MSQDVYEDEVKSLVKTVVWNILVNHDIDISRHENSTGVMEEIANEVWSVLWEYISDPD